MRKAVIFFMALAVLMVISTSPAHAQVQLPHAFYGNVLINGAAAPDGTQVSATVDTGEIISTQNPVTTLGGSYGVNRPRLLVQGDIPEGATIRFYVNDVSTGQTATFQSGGGPTRVDLSVIAAPPPGGGVGGAPTYYIETNLFGIEERYRIESDGEILAAIEATSADGLLTMTIPKGTIALGKDGKRLKSLQTAVDESPPDPPEDCCIIGLAFDFGPEGATFDPGITFEYTYDPAELPGGVAEADLVIAFYDAEAGEWVTCDCTCDPEANCITACVCHFTTFAIIGAVTPPEEEEVAPPEEEEVAPPEEVPVKPAAFTTSSLSISPTEADIGQSVTISVLVANTGDVTGSYEVTLKINNVAVATQDVTLAGGASQTVTFTTAKDAAGTYTVNIDGLSGTLVVKAPPVEVPAPINWPLIGGIIAAVVVAALLIYFLVVRRRAA